jgi:SAM-dependent methyltransferase
MSGQGHHHQHGHQHKHGADFDWESMADRLEVDGAMALPLVDAVVDALRTGVVAGEASHVIDAGCGPGVVTCALARHFPAAEVTGLDSAGALLERLRRRAAVANLADRVRAVEADIELGIPELPPADVVWASMVVHHAADPTAVLRRLHGILRPGGTLVMIEFGGRPEVLPPGDPLVAGGAWQRLEDAATASLLERLGFDAVGHDWQSDLSRAGFVDVNDRIVTFRHEAPLDEIGRSWLARHARRGLEMAGDALSGSDAAALDAFATAVESGGREDAFVAAERRVLTARRPA